MTHCTFATFGSFHQQLELLYSCNMQPNICFVCTQSLILQGQLSARTHSLETFWVCKITVHLDQWSTHGMPTFLFPSFSAHVLCCCPFRLVSFPFIAWYFVPTPSGTCFNDSGYLPRFSSKYLLAVLRITFMIYHHNKLCFYTAVCYSFF